MSEPPNPVPPDLIPDEMHVLAGEYVLGALEASEMRAVRRQAMVDPTLAAAIAAWERRLAPMAEAVPEVPPPEALWERIEHAVAPSPHDGADPAVEQLGASRPRRVAALQPLAQPLSELQRLRPAPPGRRVWPWQVATTASLALAASVAGVVLMPSLALRLHMPMLTPMLDSRFAPEVAVLMPHDSHSSIARVDTRTDGTAPQMAADNGSTPRYLGDARTETATPPMAADARGPGFLVEARRDGTVVLTALAPVEVAAGKSLELWILPPGAAAPRSLGVLPTAGSRVTLPSMPPHGTSLLVSVEPAGGSPTGQPTGPVVFSGKLGGLPS